MDRPAPTATRLVARLEPRIYLVAGIDPAREMDWQGYSLALLMFNGLGTLAVYAFQRLQHLLPLNPQRLAPVSPQSAFNTAISFVTNTNWQGYAGETTMSYLTQMAALTVQNFLSAASGIVVAVALVRGFSRHSSKTIGNCWADLTRATLFLLLPLAGVLALILAAQGVVQTLGGNTTVTTLEPTAYLEQPATGSATVPPAPVPAGQVVVRQQVLPMGPVASQESIKQLGTNGGGFMNANSAHPFENPSALTNLLSIVAMLLIPMALTYTFGHLVGDTRQGWALLAAVLVLLVPLVLLATHAEQRGNPLMTPLGIDQVGLRDAAGRQHGGQGSPLRHRLIGIVRNRHHGDFLRRDRCGA